MSIPSITINFKLTRYLLMLLLRILKNIPSKTLIKWIELSDSHLIDTSHSIIRFNERGRQHLHSILISKRTTFLLTTNKNTISKTTIILLYPLFLYLHIFFKSKITILLFVDFVSSKMSITNTVILIIIIIVILSISSSKRRASIRKAR